MASEPLLEFDQEFKGKDWYTHSLSETLSNWARELQPNYLKTTPVGEPVHHDLGFVRDGYKDALKNILALLESREGPDAHHPSVEYLRRFLLPLFEARFMVWDLDLGLREFYYGGSWKA
ncbi:hypothetical protein FRC06_008662 [Ceratobasidium sp. 370]|nr:hypothetical protein FRC06_008662 [Ceratobasidium sp. 370]